MRPRPTFVLFALAGLAAACGIARAAGLGPTLPPPRVVALQITASPTPTPSPNQAIDGGNPSGCTDYSGNTLTTDQRGAGFSRAKDGGSGSARCDIGAYEK